MSIARNTSGPSMRSLPWLTWGTGPWPWRGRMAWLPGPPNHRTPSGALTMWSRETRVFAASAFWWVQSALPGIAPGRRIRTKSPFVSSVVWASDDRVS